MSIINVGGSFLNIGSGPLSSGAPGAGGAGGRALGMNLSELGYYSNEQPFLNIFKSAGSAVAASSAHGWITTSTGPGGTTGEEAFLPLDADGYPTSVTGSTVGKTFTSVWTAVNVNIAAVVGVTYPYGQANVNYTVLWDGDGTMAVAGDASATLTASGQTFTVSSPGFTGLQMSITTTDRSNTGNNLRNVRVVETALLASFQAGAIFHPKFLATIPSYSTLRPMDWNQTNSYAYNYPGEFTAFTTTTGTIPAGAISLDMNVNWPFASQSRNVYFNDGTVRNATFIAGSPYVQWTGGLPIALSTTFAGQNCYCNFWISWKDTWSLRSKPSNAFWSLAAGVPLEIIVALANLQNSNPWFNVPLSAPDSYVTNMVNLIYSGTGMQSGFSALATSRKARFELSNEVWNSFAFQQYCVAGSLGSQVWPSQASNNGAGSGNYGWNRNYFGMRTAIISEIVNGIMGSRGITVLGAQAAATDTAIESLETPYWTSAVDGYTGPAKAHYISDVAIAPYWMDSYPSSGDITTINAQADPVGALFTCMTGNVVGGTTLSSVPYNGWRGQAQARISTYLALLSSSYPTLKLVAYEGGQNLLSGNVPSGWLTIAEAAQIDSRMYTQFLSYMHFWYSNAGTTDDNVCCIYTNCLARQASCWGVLESSQQTLSPESSAPYKWQALQDAIAGA